MSNFAKTKFGCLAVAFAILAIASTALAQSFSSGSDGSYGPLIVVTNTTLTLPANGIFNCTTITISNGATLKFNKNLLNTPVYLLATGDVTIDNAFIDISGKNPTAGQGGQGGPGGFDGGTPANGQGEQAGDGLGPGAGIGSTSEEGGAGAYGTRPAGTYPLDGQIYGNTVIFPLIGGSGGGGYIGSSFSGGGGGGGAIMIASNTKISFLNSAQIFAKGGQTSHHGYGSGGAVRFVAPEVRANSGASIIVSSRGGDGSPVGGAGRVRVDAVTRFDLFLTVDGGNYTVGKFMQVFPTNSPRLDIIGAAGTNITEGSPGPILVQLPSGAPTNQTVTIQARNFTGVVLVTLAVTPDAGPSARYDTLIDMSGRNVVQTNMNVVIPAGTTSKIYAWTR